MIETVECYLIKDNSYLMLHRNKRQNDMHEGKYIGIGGHIEKGETKDEACIREIKEETGLDVHSMKYCGQILFVNDDYEEMMYIYKSNDFSGNLIECDEGTLHWVSIDKVLDLNLWEGDKLFHPKLKSGELINMKLIYKNNVFVGCEEL
ncbi:MAG: 8-oxo-dGTP diphosphatase [Acholeplasmatales bacterium]|nr:8-oxo-dGTP diphosphatase [Acholeplasmatales bacterium]